jgi:hypothetical protein
MLLLPLCTHVYFVCGSQNSLVPLTNVTVPLLGPRMPWDLEEDIERELGEQQRLGGHAHGTRPLGATRSRASPSAPAAAAAAAVARPAAVGDRVVVTSTRRGGDVERGVLRFLGETSFAAGVWAGVELDVPETGKNDGQVDGTRYFRCEPLRGVFVKPSRVLREPPPR